MHLQFAQFFVSYQRSYSQMHIEADLNDTWRERAQDAYCVSIGAFPTDVIFI